jgi:hypothetical protein
MNNFRERLKLVVVLFFIFGLSSPLPLQGQTDSSFYELSPEIEKGRTFQWKIVNYIYEHTFNGIKRDQGNFIDGQLLNDVTHPLFGFQSKFIEETPSSVYSLTIDDKISMINRTSDVFKVIIDGFTVTLNGEILDLSSDQPGPPLMFIPPRSTL